MYNFIEPRSKTLLSPELKLMFIFFSITLFLLFSTYLFLAYKNYDFIAKRANYETQRVELHNEIKSMNVQIEKIQLQEYQAEEVYTSNIVLKESIKNLFDLVPDRITLSKADMDKNSLILHGITPNKEIYEFMLHAPLRSIFHRTYSNFYPLRNGWYRFVSSNYLDVEDEN